MWGDKRPVDVCLAPAEAAAKTAQHAAIRRYHSWGLLNCAIGKTDKLFGVADYEMMYWYRGQKAEAVRTKQKSGCFCFFHVKGKGESMEFKKNDVLIIDIEDMGHDGEGIGKADGYTLFVKDTVIGDRAEVKIMKTKKNYGYARLLKVLRPSPDRTEPRCPIARACGGCQLQFLSYEKQLEFKKKKVLENLQRIGGFADIQAERVLGMEDPWRYRNKAQFPVGRNKEGEIVTGFYAGRTHSIVPNRDCLLGVEGKRRRSLTGSLLIWRPAMQNLMMRRQEQVWSAISFSDTALRLGRSWSVSSLTEPGYRPRTAWWRL